MKKVILLCLVVLMFSCSKEQSYETSEEQNLKQDLFFKNVEQKNELTFDERNLLILKNKEDHFIKCSLCNPKLPKSKKPAIITCSINLINPTPITYQTVTFELDCDNYFQTPCLTEELNRLVTFEIWDQNIPVPGVRVVSQSLYGYNDLNFHWDEVGVDTNNNYWPYLDSDRANELYEAVVCKIQNDINSLPSLPYNQCYSIGFYYLSVDFDLGNFDNPYVGAFYYIYLNELDN